MTEHLSVVDRGPVRVITLVQPSRRNALTPAMLGVLTRALPTGSASLDQPLRVVILEGAGGVFSAGFDLDALDEAERARGVDPMTAAADAIAACPVPVIAAVDGHCHGGAVELCAACPIVVAAPDTRRRLGAAAERVLLTGAAFSADDARAWGLVHEVVDDARAAARQLADAIAAAAPIAVAGTLAALRAVDDGDAEAVAAARVRALASDDFREGLLAWKQKRPPVFGGR
jgi:2-(1,2-epoxy-1,2-dihydrophenyl)acetyl-CoA isomerase